MSYDDGPAAWDAIARVRALSDADKLLLLVHLCHIATPAVVEALDGLEPHFGDQS